jgi:glutamine synthetase
MLYRFVVREVAKRNGYHASFMPKPIFGVNGSGMHVHQSLFKGKSNAFFKEGAPYHLSEMSGHYIAGLLKHVGEFAAITNQWVNSYKRVVPGYEAPVYISWGLRNRSALVRVPCTSPARERDPHRAARSGPCVQPYLAFAAMLAAGIDGVEKKLPLPAPLMRGYF